MTMTISVDNIKCGGCAQRIESQLATQKGVDQVAVNVDRGTVAIEGAIAKSQAIQLLRDMGYPLTGTGDAINTAKSFVSCMIGRIEKAKKEH